MRIYKIEKNANDNDFNIDMVFKRWNDDGKYGLEIENINYHIPNYEHDKTITYFNNKDKYIKTKMTPHIPESTKENTVMTNDGLVIVVININLIYFYDLFDTNKIEISKLTSDEELQYLVDISNNPTLANNKRRLYTNLSVKNERILYDPVVYYDDGDVIIFDSENYYPDLITTDSSDFGFGRYTKNEPIDDEFKKVFQLPLKRVYFFKGLDSKYSILSGDNNLGITVNDFTLVKVDSNGKISNNGTVIGKVLTIPYLGDKYILNETNNDVFTFKLKISSGTPVSQFEIY